MNSTNNLQSNYKGIYKHRILITGGAGFVGSHLAEILSKTDSSNLVVVADNFFLGRTDNLNEFSKLTNTVIERTDVSSIPALLHLINKYEINIIWNLAIVPLPTSFDYPDWTLTNNINCAKAICEAARLVGNLRIINISSSETFGSARYVPMDENHPYKPETPYAASKAAADLIFDSYSKTFGLSFLTLRPFNMFGPRQNKGSYAGVIPIVIDKLLNNDPIEVYGDGNQTRDFMFVKDSVEAALIAEKNWSGLESFDLNIGTQVETSINNLIQMIAEILQIQSPKIIYKSKRKGDVDRHCADITKFKKFTGCTVRSISNDSLSITVNWYRNHA